jgi:pimeloyl-ACP methyl ester carboxylesterase
MVSPIDRAFVRLPEGLVHLRRIDGVPGTRPLVMLHASPGSSRGIAPLVEALGARPEAPTLIAPDMPGNGDSDAFVPDAADIGWYAQALVRLLDRMGIGEFDLYGTHTGARIAVEAAASCPDRVGRLILDGLTDYPPAMRDLLLRDYAPEMAPDDHGGHLIRAFHYIRDQSLHFPHFLRDPAHRLMTRAVPPAAELHAATVELLKGLTSYHKAYRAAFRYDAAARLADVRGPAMLLLADGELPDLRAATAGLAARLADGRVEPVGRTPAEKADAIARFLGFTS